MLQHFCDKKLQAKHSKSDFLSNLLQFLGHIVLGKRVVSDPEKGEAISKLSVPTNVHTFYSFPSCCNLYECFIPRYAHISAPLIDLFCTGAEWQWGLV